MMARGLSAPPYYSVIDHVARSRWLNEKARDINVAVFTAYFDASGHPDAAGLKAALVVAGFVSPLNKWRRFERDWLALLSAYSIKPSFHMTDFMSDRAPKYKDWWGQHQQKNEFVEKAIRLVHRRTHNCIAHGVVLEDLDWAFKTYEMIDLPPEPFAFCGASAVILLMRWLIRKTEQGAPIDKLQIIFEDRDADKGKFMDYVRDRFGIIPQFLPKKSAVPFQACDMIGWIVRRSLTDIHAHGKAARIVTGSHLLAQMLPRHAMAFHNRDTMTRAAVNLGILRRTNAPRD